MNCKISSYKNEERKNNKKFQQNLKSLKYYLTKLKKTNIKISWPNNEITYVSEG